MASEDTPLLKACNAAALHDHIYDRFTPSQKRWIIFVVSFAGFLPMLVQTSFVPSIPQMAKDLNTTQAVISLTVSLSIFATAIGAQVWATYSSFYGRRMMYLCGMPFVCIGSCGIAMSTSLQSLLFWQFVQTFGCSGGMSLGAGVISDTHKLEERGTGIGIFFGATLLGFALAPLLGGVATEYWSWRNLHYCLAVWGLVEMLLIYLFLPETSHPGAMGIEKVTPRRKLHIAWVNPLSSLWLLRSPNLFAGMFASSLVLISGYALLVPFAYTIGVRYNIANEAVVGACFIPCGLGSFIGAPVAGRMSDIIVRKWQLRRKGMWYPEDRLRATWIGGLIMVPLSVGASGLITTYVDGPIGLSLNLICLFMHGMGVDFALNPLASYNVDVVNTHSAEITAAYISVRSLILAATSTLIIPSIEYIGVAWTNIIAAILALMGQGIIFLMICYGDRMRASMDLGFGL